ncbi:MAG: hypothetical protein RIB54_14400 [Fulvivirga sp.]|jgi:hypothetical protein|uniref:hypothetical protein n=1 Tax=Fulvivirga sp. TaxID=1931237 RepID=UPI0032EABE4C
MKTGKKIALFLGIATGAAVAVMTLGKTSKKNRNIASRSVSKSGDKKDLNSLDDSDINYV